MKNSYEIERKFLVAMPDVSQLDVSEKWEIIQTYLTRGENDSQRRVRKIKSEGITSYTYTEKIFLSHSVRKEFEKEISQQEYDNLIAQADSKLAPVVKIRYRFSFRNQLFELDVYNFENELAIMELELENLEQEIFLPDFINVIKEVTDDRRYSNSSLANAGEFPHQ